MAGPLASANGLPCSGVAVNVMAVCHARLHLPAHLAYDAWERFDAAHVLDLIGSGLVPHAGARTWRPTHRAIWLGNSRFPWHTGHSVQW
jgi:hypothetical protein